MLEHNRTHLNIYLEYGATLPYSLNNYFSISRKTYIYIDLDNNPHTGEQSWGYEAYIRVYHSSLNYNNKLELRLYNETGDQVFSYTYDNLTSVSTSSSYLNASIQLSYLNIS